MSLNVLLLFIFASLALAAQCPSLSTLQTELGSKLTKGSTIGNAAANAPRWSLFSAPIPQFVVNVTSENDVATTVKYSAQRNLTFVTQNGGNGWATTFDLRDCGLVINIGNLRQITFNADKTSALIQGGAGVQEMVNAAYANDTRFANPTCNCLGFLGAALGGGLTRTSGLYGWSVDQLLSANVVLASGEAVQVSNVSNPDLWWALKGAAPNFGIVTSANISAYPVPQAQNVAWQGPIVFAEDKLEEVVETINSLVLSPHMEIDFLLATSGSPSFKPTITAIPFYAGRAPAAKKAFAPLLNISSISNSATEFPYTQWSKFTDSFCEKGERKPTYGVSARKLDAPTWRTIYEEFERFVNAYGAAVGDSSILAEKYGVKKAVAIGDGTSSYPFRDVPLHIVVIPWYANASFDPLAEDWGNKIRDLLRSTDGLAQNSTYINFAHGDESLDTIYGESLERLQPLKKKYDPQNRFNQWFPLQ